MIRITDEISLDEKEITLEFVRASGPGGQNVNKVATAVQLRFDAASSPNLPPDVKERLARLAGGRMTKEGVLVLDARRHRTQEKNRADAFTRLAELIERASRPPKPRLKKKVPRSAILKRLERKHKRAEKKLARRPVRSWD